MKKRYISLVMLLAILGCVNPSDAKMTKEAHVLYQQASNCEYSQDMAGAIKLIKKAIDVNGDDDVMLLTKLAGLYTNTEKYREAIDIYKRVLELRPNDAFIYVSLGNIYQTIGENVNSLNAYNKALELCPEYKYNYINIANIELLQKHYSEAEKYYTMFLELYPNNDDAKSGLAETYFMNNQPQKACEIFKQMYDSNPKEFKEYVKYGAVLYNTKQYKEAIPILEKAVETDSNSIKSLAFLALSYQQLDDFENAEKTYKKLFEVAPGMNEFRLDYANLLSSQSKDAEAIVQYNDYIKAYPNDAEGYINLGALYKRTDKDDLAIKNFVKAYELSSDDMDTIKDLAFLYHKKGEFDKALKFYDKALAKEPDNYSYKYNKAIALHSLERLPEAIAVYEEILTTKSDETIKTNLNAALIEYGYKLLDENKTADAKQNFEKAIKMNPKEASAYFGMALTSRVNGEKESALSYFQKALDLDPKNEEYISAYNDFKSSLSEGDLDKMVSENSENKELEYATLVAKADSLFSAKKYKQALEPYEKALKLRPDNKEIMLKIGNIYKNNKDLVKASEYYKKGIELDEKYTDAWFNLGLVYANTNKLNDAIDCFNRVVMIDSKYTYAYYALGLAYEYEHNNSKAVENYKKYIQLEKDQSLISAVNSKIKQLEK